MSDLARALLDEIAADPEAIERLRRLLGARHDDGRWIGVHEAAEHLSCRPQRIYDLVHQRRIPHERDGSRLLFRRPELDKWLKS
jgi:excisionase family DNA binding protein